MTELVARTVAGFTRAFDARPAGVWSAPGRVNLIGEHTDYNDGFVLPLAINRRTYAAVALREDSTVRVASSHSPEVIELDFAQIAGGQALDWASYPLGVAWAMAQVDGVQPQGFDAYFDSDLPVGAGLSSSAAIECSIALALNDLWAAGLDRRTLARCAQRGENEIAGAPTGIMDQSASLLGKRDHAVFLDCRSLEADLVDLGFAANQLTLLIIDTRVAHRLVDGGYASRRAACETAAAKLQVAALRDLSETDLPRAKELLNEQVYRRARHVITENARVLQTLETLKTAGPTKIGALLYESHKSMRDDFEISIDELDAAVETAIRHGAIGARMTGGGFGGAAIALVAVERASEVTLAVRAEFEQLGYQEPNIFSVSADEGARREA